MTTKRCPDCGNVDDSRWPHKCRYPELVRYLELRGVLLTTNDHRLLKWLAGWERETAEWVESLVERAFRAGASGKPH